MIDWEKTPAAIYRANRDRLKPVFEIDPIRLENLINIDEQKTVLVENTKKFLSGQRALHALLWGSRGTGKSSLVKALLNEFFESGLRIIEISKDDLKVLSDICDDIRDLPFCFIIFCDDLSFGTDDTSYKSLKSILEGSIELPPKNVLIYATSNRRHLVPEYKSDNDGVLIRDGEIHYSDVVEEKISLSDRFGIWLSFYQGTQRDFLDIVDSYFPNLNDNEREKIHKEAIRFSSLRASRSGRVAKQFYLQYEGK
jgi:predicted AAA+ superfamily ATPase